MFLGTTLSSASSGLDAVERQLAVLSQNVSNANTPNYTHETVPLSSLDTAGGPAGVRAGVAQRDIDTNLQSHLFAAVADESGKNVVSNALAAIDQASGQPNSGQDIASLLGNLKSAYSSLSTDPSSGTQQLDVLSKAGALVNGIHSLAGAIVQGRQTAQDTLSQDVTSVNDALRQLGTLSKQIIAAKAAGQSTAGLEDQRDTKKQTLAQLIGARFVDQPDGDTLAIAGNSVLPLDAASGPFSLGTANFSGTTPSAAVPPLLLSGQAVSGLGGEVGANLTLRDTTLPALQSSLDSFSQSLASTFNAQTVPLFTDPSGAVPSTVPLGFSSTIQVSAAITAAPTMLRDGTGPTLQASDTSIIQNVMQGVFSTSATGLPAQASSLVASYAGQAAQAASDAGTSTALRTSLASSLSNVSGVSVDAELSKMVALENAYAANAKVVTAVETMWTQLLQSV